MNTFTPLRALIVAAAAALTIAGCSGTNEHSGNNPDHNSSVSAAQDRNDADIRFAHGMVPHHQQAVEMAQLAPSRAQNPKVQDLAKRIEAAQAPEVKVMNEWLRKWGAPPAASGHSAGGHSAGSMMTPEQMDQLGKARGAAFDRLFLQLMIEHHKGAIEISTAEVRDGRSDEAKKLAQTIIDAQQGEIAEMQGVLQQL